MAFTHFNQDRPVVLIGLEGVLSPISHHRPSEWGDYTQVGIHGHPLWISRRMCHALSKLDATFVWCSTWSSDPFGLIDVARKMGWLRPLWMGSWGGDYEGKRDLVAQTLEASPFVVWLEDDEAYIGPRHERLLHIAPTSRDGLTEDDVEHVRFRLDRWWSRQPPRSTCMICHKDARLFSHQRCIRRTADAAGMHLPASTQPTEPAHERATHEPASR